MKKIVLLLVLVLGLGGCAKAPSQVGSALFGFTKEPISVTSNENEAKKTGQACGRNILGLVSYGDFSIKKAKEKGKITQVATSDKKITNIFFVYSSVCTVVTGS